MVQLEKNPDKKFLYILGTITLVGFLLRMNGIGSESVTADEASALFRLKFSTLSEMIKGGVQPDGHPAFTQILLWYCTKWFGISEFAIRLPFVLFGTGSIWLSGIVARKWFSSGTGIITASAMAFLQFPLMYSQLARPYAPGLFFTMLALYFWTKFVNNKSQSKKDIFGFGFAVALAAYSHYFSLLTTTLLAVSGIFFVAKEIRMRYLLACAIGVLLFVPHLSITLSQMEIGGIGGPGGWLGKPEPRFVLDHLKFIFDGSRGLMWFVFGICGISAIVFYKRPQKLQLLALALWVLPLLIGYFYSTMKNPVLQDSVLLFSFPFLLMFLFSRFPEMELNKIAKIIPIVFSLTFLGYVTIYKPYRLMEHFGRLNDLVSYTTAWQERFGKKNVDVVYNVDGPFMIEYNYQRLNKKAINVLSTSNNGGNDLLELKNMVQNSNASFFVYGWSTKYSPLEILPIIKEKFPYLIRKELWYNSAIYCFAKSKNAGTVIESDVMFHTINELDPESTYSVKLDTKQNSKWLGGSKKFLEDSFLIKTDTITSPYSYGWTQKLSSNYVELLDSSCLYSPSLKMKVGDILKNPDNEILFTIGMKQNFNSAVAVLVIQFDRDGKQLYWNGLESSTQMDLMEEGKWQNVYFGLRLPKDLLSTDTVSFFCYSKDGKPILLNYLDVQTLKGHTGIYGPRPDFE